MRRVFFCFVLICVASAASAEEPWADFTFSKMNGPYDRVDEDVSWTPEGPVSMTLSSPDHQLEVLENNVQLRPIEEGVYETRTRVRFRGEGDLVAKIDALGSAGDLRDHVVVPEQEVEVDAKVRFVSLSNGDVQVVSVWMPKTLSIRIQSGLGEQLYGICNIALAILGIDCSMLERVFTTAIVPLPEPGTSTTLTAEQLSPGERQRLREYLAATGGFSTIAATAGDGTISR